jgi:hypothetical protein
MDQSFLKFGSRNFMLDSLIPSAASFGSDIPRFRFPGGNQMVADNEESEDAM